MDEPKDLYSAEQQILKALPRMAKTAHSPELKDAFTRHWEQTRGQVERLDRIFRELRTNSSGRKCAGIKGILEEDAELLKEKADP